MNKAILIGGAFLWPAVIFAQTRLGIDELEKNGFAEVRYRHVALITNQTGFNGNGESTVDVLRRAPGVTLVCILTPEHGFLGTAEHGQSVADGKDPETGLPVYSLYGANQRPTDAMLKKVNTIVFDIQDVGARFYTYITTMGMVLEEAAKRKIPFVVLDRPNPVRGDILEGDVLDDDVKRMTGYFPIPTRYGLTVGELALWWNQAKNLNADVRVVRLRKWSRDQWFDQTGLPFTPPSPNIRSDNQALLYGGVGCFEATNVAVGRGTATPFEIIGAPWIKSKALCAYLREQNFPGILFESIEFVPDKDIYQGALCQGVRLIVTDREKLRPFRIFAATFLYLYRTYPKEFKPDWEEVRVVTGSHLLQQAALGQLTVEEFWAKTTEKIEKFREQRKPFLLY